MTEPYPCLVPGCEAKAEPWDTPFCPAHGWDDYRSAVQPAAPGRTYDTKGREPMPGNPPGRWERQR